MLLLLVKKTVVVLHVLVEPRVTNRHTLQYSDFIAKLSLSLMLINQDLDNVVDYLRIVTGRDRT